MTFYEMAHSNDILKPSFVGSLAHLKEADRRVRSVVNEARTDFMEINDHR
jgi:hypothetical protein